jgi:hypothetical protein
MLDTGDTRPARLLRKAEAAAVLGITKTALQKRIDRGTATAQKVDGQWFVSLPADMPETGKVYPEHTPAGEPVYSNVQGEMSRLQQEIDDLKKDRDAWREMALSNAAALRTLALPSPAVASDQAETNTANAVAPGNTAVQSEIKPEESTPRRRWWIFGKRG